MRKGLEAFCIFLGRCAGEILKDETPLLQVFIYADDIKQKIRRIVELDGVPERDAQSSLHRKDAERKNYYGSSAFLRTSIIPIHQLCR